MQFSCFHIATVENPFARLLIFESSKYRAVQNFYKPQLTIIEDFDKDTRFLMLYQIQIHVISK